MELRHRATITRSAGGGSVNETSALYEGGDPDTVVLTDEPCLVRDGGFRVVRNQLGEARIEYPPEVLIYRPSTVFEEGDQGVFVYEGYTRNGIVTKITPVASENAETILELKWDEPLQT